MKSPTMGPRGSVERRRTALGWLSASLLAALLLGACGSGSPGSAPAFASPVAPVAPLAHATGVPINTRTITAAFVKTMDPATLTAQSFTLACPTGTPVTGTVTYLVSSRVATLTLAPVSDLPSDTLCTVTLTTAIRDTGGIPLASNFQWTFTTGSGQDNTAPTVSSPIPLDLAIDVPINTAVTAIFNETMDPLTITPTSFLLACPSGTPMTGAVAYGVTGRVASFTPTPGTLPSSTLCTATLTTDVRDLAGNALAAPYSWTFSTAAAASFCVQDFIQADHYNAPASINGQNGWTSSGGFDEQVMAIGDAAHAGQNVWKLGNRIISTSYGNQPLSPPLSESVGESTVRSAGGGDAMEVVFWVRPMSFFADGSAITLSLSPPGGNRQTYLRIENNLDANGGNQLRVIDYLNAATTNEYRTFLTAVAISRSAWTKVRMVMETPDGSSNDIFQIFLNDQLAGTYSTWEDYHTWALGGNSVPLAVDRLMFRASVAPHDVNPVFADAGAQGYALDQLCYRAYSRAAPGTTLQFYRTGFEP